MKTREIIKPQIVIQYLVWVGLMFIEIPKHDTKEKY